MKKFLTTAPAVLTALLVALSGAGQATAAQSDPVGARINVFAGTPTTFPAGEAFHITHGWGVGATDPPNAAGLWEFRLDVDGVPRAPDIVERSAGAPPQAGYEFPLLSRFWTFNFASGMTGTHTFTGHWIGPCQFIQTSCATPNAQVESFARSVTVTFVRTNLALGKSVTASSEYPGNPASLAVDGDWYSYWNSGNFPPQWIEVDLGAVKAVGEIDLGITQLPDSLTVHRVYGRASVTDPWTLLTEFNGFTVDQQTLQYLAATPQQLRYVRVETVTSASWVAWREISVYGP
jgi:F5/8 type C domain-containing protein